MKVIKADKFLTDRTERRSSFSSLLAYANDVFRNKGGLHEVWLIVHLSSLVPLLFNKFAIVHRYVRTEGVSQS